MGSPFPLSFEMSKIIGSLKEIDSLSQRSFLIHSFVVSNMH